MHRYEKKGLEVCVVFHSLPRGRAVSTVGRLCDVTHDDAVVILQRLPGALDGPHRNADRDIWRQVGSAKEHEAKGLSWEESGGAAELAALQEDLENGPVYDAFHAPGAGEEVVDGELIGEEGLVETSDVAAIDEEWCVSTKVETHVEGFVAGWREEGDVECRVV